MVFEPDENTMTAKQFLENNVKKSFEKRRGGPQTTRVAFRFNQRLHDENTAFESGVFLFQNPNKEGEVLNHYIQFEFLLVRESGRWLILMEKQKARVTKDEWDAAGELGKVE